MPTLLLADDSVTIQRVIQLTFASEDVRVVTTSDGASAIQRMEMDPPDIVLADVGMPRVDGYAVAAYMKQSPSLRGIPVLLLAGAFEPIDEEKARESGCDGVLVKPFEPQQLVGRVRELLNGRPPPRLGLVPRSSSAGTSVPEQRETQPHEVLVEETFRRELDQLDAAFGRLDPETLVTNPDGETDPDIARDLELYRTGAVGSSRALGGWDLPTPPPQATVPPVSAAAGSVEFPAGWTLHDGRDSARDAGGRAPEPPPASADAPIAPAADAPKAARPAATAGLTMADAFAALLEAERTQVEQAPQSRVAISEAMMEAIVRRALARMSEETVRRLVAETAARLVREEIERFKQNAE